MNRQQTIQQIAQEHLDITTLERRRRDNLDFHDVAVWQVEKALAAAYDAGRDELLATVEALLAAKDNQMETAVEWRRLRRAAKQARRGN